MTINTKYSIGDPVWHASGAYQVQLHRLVFSIKITFNEFGKLTTMYSFPEWSDNWVDESELHSTPDELNKYSESLK
jgi:hypothetical protein